MRKRKYKYKNKSFKPNKFEQYIYGLLAANGFACIPQYELKGKYYDAYLPDYNCLVEFDGIYYHKESFDECINKMQRKNLFNDIRKNKIANISGFKLLRIRENTPEELIINELNKLTKVDNNVFQHMLSIFKR